MPTYRRRACAARPPRSGTAGRRLRERGCHPEAGKTETTRFAGADRPPACSMLPPRELASSRIGLGAVPVPRIEEISRARHLHTAHARTGAVLGQRGRQVLRPNCRDAVGGAAPAGPHAAAGIYPLAHPRADHRRSGCRSADLPVTRRRTVDRHHVKAGLRASTGRAGLLEPHGPLAGGLVEGASSGDGYIMLALAHDMRREREFVASRLGSWCWPVAPSRTPIRRTTQPVQLVRLMGCGKGTRRIELVASAIRSYEEGGLSHVRHARCARVLPG